MAHPGDPDVPCTLARLEQLLDAYGAAAERWPADERRAAERLLARSAAARARWQEAAALDRLLDAVPAATPSATLTARVLAAAPRRRAPRPWRAALAVLPLAAAAAVLFWIVRAESPTTSAPGTAVALGELGEYESPTDVLLGAYGVDFYASVPAIGCADSTLGCPNVPSNGGPSSELERGRSLA
jgi:hypothetical protein